MAKDKLTDYSATNASNTDIGGVNIDEGMLPSDVNNALREQMTHLKNFAEGTDAINALDVVGGVTAESAVFDGTGAVKLPVGTTAQRPTPVQGQIRYNTTDGSFEGYDGSAWGAIGGAGESSFTLYEYTATSGQTTFSGADDNAATLDYTVGNILVTLNGVVLDPADYTATTGTSVVLASGAATSDVMNIVAFSTFSVADTVSASSGGTFSGTVNFASNATFGDNDKAIFGAGSDLQIYHDGSNSYIKDVGTGNLFVDAQDLRMRGSNGDVYATFIENGASTLYYDGLAKLATTSTGIDVTGTITFDGGTTSADLNFGDNDKAVFGNKVGGDLVIFHDGSDSYITDLGTGNLRIGATNLKITNAADTQVYIDAFESGAVNLRHNNSQKLATTASGIDVTGTVTADGLTVDTNTLYVDSTNNRVGIGTSSPNFALDVASEIGISEGNALAWHDGSGGRAFDMYASGADNSLRFRVTGSSEVARLDASGNLLVGTTSTSIATTSTETGTQIYDGGISIAANNPVVQLNRLSTDGSIAVFRKDGTTVGGIGTEGGDLTIGTGNTGFQFYDFGSAIRPWNFSSNTGRDNAIDLGTSGDRYDDIYATNGTIQTSDQNEKQQIASLTTAEMTAAKAISKLFKTFKWNDKVAAKGDAARTHTGVIAQDVEAAMTAAGLDAGDYAFFISTTWWEADGETYYNADDAPEGATEHNRKGIRYPELLSFVGAATEQRLANIETRLAALENVQ